MNISEYVGKEVNLTFKTRRVIAGVLRERDGEFTVKLGALHISVDPDQLTSVELR